MKTLCTSQ